MNKMMRLALIAIFGMAVLCAGGVKKAQATMMISVSDGTNTVVYTDEVGGIGVLSGPGPVPFRNGDDALGLFLGVGTLGTGTVFTSGSSVMAGGQSKPRIGSATRPVTDLNGVVTGSGTFTLMLTDTGFGPTTAPFGMALGGLHTGGGTFSISVDYFADLANTPFGMGISLGSLGSITNSPFAVGGHSGPFAGASYSLTTRAVITQTAGTTTFDAAVQPVPEPGTIALLGIGLAGLVGVGVRRKMKKKED